MGSLISTNPAMGGAQDMANLQRQQQAINLGRLTYEESRRTADAERAVDQALRDWILQDGGLGQTGGDVGQTQPAAALGGGGMPAASPMPTAPGAGGSLQAVRPPAPGPQATMGRGDEPGFQGMLSQVLPPEMGRQQQNDQRWAEFERGVTSGQIPYGEVQPIPNAVPGQSGAKMVLLQDKPMPGTITTPGAATTMGLDRQELARRLAQIEGGGTAAFELLREQEEMDSADAAGARESHDKAVTNFFAAIDKGDVYSAQYWAAQAGMEIGDEMYGDAEAMRILGIAGKYKTFYGSDVESFGQFLETAFKRVAAGDPNAFQSAFQLHRPKRVAGQSRIVSPQNQAYAALLEKHKGDAVAAYREWKSIGAGGGQGGGTTFEQRKAFAEKLYPTDPEAQANFINGRTRPSRTEIRKLAVDELKARYGSSPPRGDDWTRELNDTIREYETLAYQSIVPPDDGALADPDPTGDGSIDMRLPKEGSAAHEADLPGVGWIGSNDGVTWYDADGNQITQ